jgi:hypothetical protein
MDKQHILDEIRRTAKNGKALGQASFLRETGFKENDWRGKYWARWGDAIAEAGYSQNDWTPAHDELHVLTSLLNLVKKLGKYPTISKWTLRGDRTPTFPSTASISRIGSKSDWVTRLLGYCHTHPGCEAVERILSATSVPTKSSNVSRCSPEISSRNNSPPAKKASTFGAIS